MTRSSCPPRHPTFRGHWWISWRPAAAWSSRWETARPSRWCWSGTAPTASRPAPSAVRVSFPSSAPTAGADPDDPTGASMEFLREFIDFFLHLDVHLAEIIARFGAGAYGILFLIVFCETGLVVTPFLPGDSLLFAAGAFAALGSFELVPLMILLIVAAIAGDTVN